MVGFDHPAGKGQDCISTKLVPFGNNRMLDAGCACRKRSNCCSINFTVLPSETRWRDRIESKSVLVGVQVERHVISHENVRLILLRLLK